MREKILNLLGMMRRANAITIGEDKAAEIVRAGKAKLLLLASDVSENAARKAGSEPSKVSSTNCVLWIAAYSSLEISAVTVPFSF